MRRICHIMCRPEKSVYVSEWRHLPCRFALNLYDEEFPSRSLQKNIKNSGQTLALGFKELRVWFMKRFILSVNIKQYRIKHLRISNLWTYMRNQTSCQFKEMESCKQAYVFLAASYSDLDAPFSGDIGIIIIITLLLPRIIQFCTGE
ncbi:hypothetical protein ACH5RR_001670 [Cinchona calisaya]|uniref:Maturase K n=1 Tax=Cinchona calisaya TaxID=153742 RepID=A0ABD3B456_9GENT